MIAVKPDGSHRSRAGCFEFEKAPSDVYGLPHPERFPWRGKQSETILIHLMKNFSTFFYSSPQYLHYSSHRYHRGGASGLLQNPFRRLRAKSVMLVEKGVADAAGIGCLFDSPEGQMIVNLGGDRTEISVISEGKTIIQRTLRTGGHTLDEDIMNMVKKQFQLNIGRKTAEALKNQLAYLLNGPALEMRVFGIHTVTGLPRQVAIPALAVSASIVDTIDAITEVVKTTMERTPPQLLENIGKTAFISPAAFPLPNLSIYMQKELEVAGLQCIRSDLYYGPGTCPDHERFGSSEKKQPLTLKDFAVKISSRIRMALKKKINDSKKSKYIFVALCIGCCALVILSLASDMSVGPLKYVSGYVITPIQKGLNEVGNWISDKGVYLRECRLCSSVQRTSGKR